jgi:hypothetical protein
MPAGRNAYHRGVCIASTLALLVAVMTSPIRTPGSTNPPAGPDYLRRNFSLAPTRSSHSGHSSHSPLKSVTLRTTAVKAVRQEDQRAKLGTAVRISLSALSPPPSASPRSGCRTPTAFVPDRGPRPLRC